MLAFNNRSTWVAVTYVTSGIISVTIQSLPARFTCYVSQTCNSESWLATGAIVLDLEKRNKYSCFPAASYAVSSAHKCGLPLLWAHHAIALFSQSLNAHTDHLISVSLLFTARSYFEK